jgi:hypothetical protein
MPAYVTLAEPTAPPSTTLHRAPLAHGGRDGGAPGLRPHDRPRYDAAFVIDPDGKRAMTKKVFQAETNPKRSRC